MTLAQKHSSYAPPHRPMNLPADYSPSREWLKLGDDGWWDFENPENSRWSWRGLASSIAKQPRYNGNTGTIWSVAQHSVLCHDQAPDEIKFFALVHDLPEGAFGDKVQPQKAYDKRLIAEHFARAGSLMPADAHARILRQLMFDLLEELERPEHDVLLKIFVRAKKSLPSIEQGRIMKVIDHRALLTEMHQLNFAPDWPLNIDPALMPFDVAILPHHRWQDSYEEYLDRLSLYVDLGAQR
ncbi:hypothetical protein [Cohaesibacter celericrescens]|uniref:Phosphohydrolase n=1 Tax=Cohaesibacter celericrescens TaxID=2067669 RepID=A0A2N5XX82_9HYPH|nr:hypothetical protein [Cohaesibacter celericrescens]PLW79099.1 hypothetical protein C0081_02385 [Cohaesibacter celericrescens]